MVKAKASRATQKLTRSRIRLSWSSSRDTIEAMGHKLKSRLNCNCRCCYGCRPLFSLRNLDRCLLHSIIPKARMATPRPSDAPSFHHRPSSGTAPHSEATPHTRKDSTTSSFFGATARPSTDALAAERGYTRDSHYAPAQSPGFAGTPVAQPTDAEAGWDVFADFNNAGPRYSSFKAQSAG